MPMPMPLSTSGRQQLDVRGVGMCNGGEPGQRQAWMIMPAAMNRRLPYFAASDPTHGATTIVGSGQGMNRRAAATGLRCCAIWKYCDVRNTAPQRLPYMQKPTRLATLKRALRKIVSGSIG